MKKIAVVALLVALAVVPVFAAEGLGLGISFGYPATGVSFSYAQKDFDVIGTVGWNFSDNGYLAAEAGVNYAWTSFNIDRAKFDVTAGLAGATWIPLNDNSQKLGLAVTVPVGIDYDFRDIPLEIFFRVSPGVQIIPDTGFYIGGTLGVLYHF
ncbi:BAPKO_0422 family outer member beta-barrel protein [Parasphaerochaeta coccoides]|uniref:Outer membrane protein beta-barrel domain-containing protein n=1 Tax=Parasphaerochaeta coccoides (strain ATCC BAA-1237 / DSM 17374 / SPN1) TaxID=760011 RepID=F4GKC5_PARC1|nr:DUF3996 domain-containing protein [Parasphaerochaeta coccoides]AEC02321.1 hypothetical protein Spico_1100 [Parasphaerochaeta coccoides DSM 17374]